jgi:uncharacterized protein
MAYNFGMKSELVKRLIKLKKNHSFFLFGPRASGKTTLLREIFDEKEALYLNLLDPELEAQLFKSPNKLTEIIQAEKKPYIIIDEIQKLPKLLDIVHHLVETTDKIFILTGSSARKLKHGGANLLAGRAFVYNLFTFSFLELGDKFDLQSALDWGCLPKVFSLDDEEDKAKYLRAYAQTYIKEEIWAEQFIKDLDPFRNFLEVAAQMNSKVLNFSKISRDIGVDDKTIKKYYSILEDTLLGFFLNPYHHSFRKRLSAKPKFYFFDTGVKKALSGTLEMKLKTSTSVYGEAFEHFIILELIKLSSYFKPDYRFSYLQTKDNAEVDLIIERPGKPVLFIEIKSSENEDNEALSNLITLSKDHGSAEAICISREKHKRKFDNVTVYPWQEGIMAIIHDNLI